MGDRIDKPVKVYRCRVCTPPLSKLARLEVGLLLRRLQRGELLSLPHSRPMPAIGSGCHGLRVVDRSANWRVIYRLDVDAIVVVAVFDKKTRETPLSVIELCRHRLADYDASAAPGE